MSMTREFPGMHLCLFNFLAPENVCIFFFKYYIIVDKYSFNLWRMNQSFIKISTYI